MDIPSEMDIPSYDVTVPSSSGLTTPLDSIPSTPDGVIRFQAKRAMTSFDNLVALANYQERLKDARKVVWRDRGEPVKELDTLRDCLEHALKGGVRSGYLAFAIRACVNVVLALMRIHRVSRDYRLALIRHAVFGLDSWRSAAMLGTFTSVYKFLINALPIIIPAISPSESSSALEDEDDFEAQLPTTTLEVPNTRRRARLSLSAHVRYVLIRKKTRRWHAALAGAIAGGLAIVWEKNSRRGLFAQQLFVRGLQGSYNAYASRKNIHIPHGDAIVFILACGPIMYGFLMRPDILPHSYNAWIGQTGRIPLESVAMNLSLVRDNKFDMQQMETVLSLPDITQSNKSKLLDFRANYLNPPSPSTYVPRYVPCAAVHPAVSSCAAVPIDRFFAVFKWMLPIYGALHFIPPILFKWKKFTKDPGSVIVRAGLGSMRSSTFISIFVVIYQTLFCYKHKLHEYITKIRMGTLPSSRLNLLKYLPQRITDLLISKASFMALGLASGFSLFIEEKRRRAELAMYVLPKGLEASWIMLRGKGLVFRTGKWGETVLTAIAMAMLMTTYQNDPQHLSGFVRRILYQFIGPN